MNTSVPGKINFVLQTRNRISKLDCALQVYLFAVNVYIRSRQLTF